MKTKELSDKKKRLSKALQNYIEYYIDKGAKEINIDTKDGFTFWSDVVLSKEELESDEHMKLFKELSVAFSNM